MSPVENPQDTNHATTDTGSPYKHLHAMLAAVEVGIWRCNLPFDRLNWDATAKEHLGFPANAEVTIEMFYERLHPDDRGRVRHAIETSIAGRTRYDIEYRTLSTAGNVRWIRASGMAFYDEAGVPVRFDGVTIDITDSIQATLNADSTRHDLEGVFERITDGFAALDRHLIYRFINSTGAALIGRSPAEVIGKSIPELFPDIVESPFWKALKRTLMEQTTAEVEEFYEPLGKWISARMFPSAQGVSVYFRDVTDEKRNQGMVRESEAQFRTLADSIPQLTWMADSTGYIFWYNRRWYEYTGMSPEQMQGWGWQSVHDPDVLPKVLESWRRSIDTGEPFDMVFPLRCADGSFRPFLTRVVPMRDSEGHIIRWFGTNTDISEQRVAENKLRSSRERLRAALEASSTGTFQWNILTNELDWDENLDRLFGLPPGETIRSLENFIELVHPQDRSEVVAQCARCARDGADFDLQFRVIWPDGTVHWLYDRGKTFCNEDGLASYMTGACVDISQRKEAESSLQERVRLAALGADVGVALTASNSLREMLRMCTDALVRHLDAAFARIWTLDATGTILELQASSGLYTHIDGGHARVPVGKFKIGLIAQERASHLTNDVLIDPRVGDHEWARREGMIAFAGYPLIVEDSIIGVAALFARHKLGPETLDALASIANSVALGIERKRNEAALRESEAHKTAVLQTALDCIITIDQDSRIVEFNPAAETTFGHSGDELTGKRMPDLLMPEKYRHLHYEAMSRYLETGFGPILGKRIELEGLRSTAAISPSNWRSIASLPRPRYCSQRRFVTSPTVNAPRRSYDRRVIPPNPRIEPRAIFWPV